MRRKATTFLTSVLVAAFAAMAVADAASAVPAWYFENEELEETETILGGGTAVQLTIPGLTTECDGFLYIMEIQNVGGTGEGEITYQPIFDCSTNTVCTVEASEAIGLPWDAGLVTAGGGDYVVVEGIQINIIYGDPECVLFETEVEIEGTIGGLFDNETESMTFDASTASASGTELEVFGQEVEFDAFLSAEAFGPHLGEALTVS